MEGYIGFDIIFYIVVTNTEHRELTLNAIGDWVLSSAIVLDIGCRCLEWAVPAQHRSKWLSPRLRVPDVEVAIMFLDIDCGF